jgi:hypothetical protein
MRGVPDVSGDADPDTGYDVRVDGTDTVIGGTSAVAPLWAALIALINSSTARAAGFVNPLLYQNPKDLRDITQGNNGGFAAQAGLGCVHGPRQPERRVAGRCSLASPAAAPSRGAEPGRPVGGAESSISQVRKQTENAGHDQINRDDVVQESGHDQDQHTGDQRDERSDAQAHVHVQIIFSLIKIGPSHSARSCTRPTREEFLQRATARPLSLS